MPRYEFSEGSSNKFWQIDLTGTSFKTCYGKIGTDGQTTVKSFGSPAEAQKEYDKLIHEKTKKGYELVGKAAAPAKVAPAKAAPAPAKAAPPPAKAAKGGAKYYEFVEGTSSKFWEINLAGTSFTTRYGKIGTDGQTTVKSFGSPAEAQKEYDKLVAEKTKKGYELVRG